MLPPISVSPYASTSYWDVNISVTVRSVAAGRCAGRGPAAGGSASSQVSLLPRLHSGEGGINIHRLYFCHQQWQISALTTNATNHLLPIATAFYQYRWKNK
jgi:hypothetical protein